MADNYDTLKEALQDEAEQITDNILKYKALILIDQYIAALRALENASPSVISYSIGGQSVTHAGLNEARRAVAEIERDLSRILFGGFSVADFRRSREI